MADLTPEQVKKIIDNAPVGAKPQIIIEGLIKKGHNLTGLDPSYQESIRSNVRMIKETENNAFTEKNPVNKGTNFFQKARNFATDIIGGKKVAEGGGLAIAAPEVIRGQEKATQVIADARLALVKRINEKKAKGEDVSRLQVALQRANADQGISADVLKDFSDALPSDKQVIGSAVRLASTFATPAIAKGVNKVAPAAGQTITQGALRGAGVGATVGGIEGALQGGGVAAENESDLGSGIATGAIGGIALGGAIGALAGGITGRSAKLKSDTHILDNVTPKASELSETDYKSFVAKGQVDPKTSLKTAQVKLPKPIADTALKYRDIIETDPVKTVVNITGKIDELDTQVGDFLRQNNGTFNRGELRNFLTKQLDNLDDVTVSEDRIQKAKKLLVNNFIDSIDNNNMEGLWQARKEFDQAAESAFRGAPTLKKQAEIAVRDAVQDFIAERTPDSTYSRYMSDMTRLFRLRDFTAIKAGKERGFNALQKIGQDNPALKYIVATAGGIFLFNQLQSSIGRIGGESE